MSWPLPFLISYLKCLEKKSKYIPLKNIKKTPVRDFVPQPQRWRGALHLPSKTKVSNYYETN